MTARHRGAATRALAAGAALLLLLPLVAAPLPSQTAGVVASSGSERRAQLEARADVIAARSTAAQGALGVVVPVGTYARASAVAGGGTVWSGGERRASARVDVVARFLLDPFLERRRGAYGGAGVSTIFTGGGRERGGGWRGYLLAVAGVEGRPSHGLLPALELGLGGGTRVGLVLRSARAEGR